jgi:hypothetical protein
MKAVKNLAAYISCLGYMFFANIAYAELGWAFGNMISVEENATLHYECESAVCRFTTVYLIKNQNALNEMLSFWERIAEDEESFKTDAELMCQGHLTKKEIQAGNSPPLSVSSIRGQRLLRLEDDARKISDAHDTTYLEEGLAMMDKFCANPTPSFLKEMADRSRPRLEQTCKITLRHWEVEFERLERGVWQSKREPDEDCGIQSVVRFEKNGKLDPSWSLREFQEVLDDVKSNQTQECKKKSKFAREYVEGDLSKRVGCEFIQ